MCVLVRERERERAEEAERERANTAQAKDICKHTHTHHIHILSQAYLGGNVIVFLIIFLGGVDRPRKQAACFQGGRGRDKRERQHHMREANKRRINTRNDHVGR